MAKRKKINKRVVLLMAVFTFIIAACIGFYLWGLPSDPTIFVKQAKASLAKSPKDYTKAVKAYKKAIKMSEGLDQAEYQFQLAELCFDRAIEVGLSPVDRRDFWSQGFSTLQMILQHHPSFIKAHRLNEKQLWGFIARTTDWKQLKDYVASVDKILKLEDDAGLYHRRGIAKMRLATNDPDTYKESAINDLRKAISLQPTETTYWQTLAEFFSYLKDDQEAEKVFKESIEANPKKANFLAAYASYLVKQKQEDQAIKLLQDAITVEPENSQSYLLLSSLHLQKKRLKEASEALAQAQKIDDSKIQIYYILSAIRQAEKDYDGAAQALRDGLKKLENMPEDKLKGINIINARKMINFWLAGVLLDIYEKSTDQAQKDKVLAEIRLCHDSLQKLAPNTVFLYQISGRVAFIDKDWNKARIDLEKTSASGGMNMKVLFRLIQVYVNLNMPGSAENLVSNALAMKTLTDEGRALFLSQLAFFSTERRAYASAREYADKALKIQPDNKKMKELLKSLDVVEGKTQDLPQDSAMGRQLMFRRAQELMQQEKYDSAIPLLEKLYAEDVKNYKILVTLVMAMERTGKKEQAVKLVTDSLRASPDHKGLKTWLLLLEEPNAEKKLQIEMKFADEETDPLKKTLARMRISRRYGQLDEMLEYLKEAEKIDPDNPTVLNELLQIAKQNKDWEKAKALAERAGKANETNGKLIMAQILISEQDAIPDAASRDYTPVITSLEELLASETHLRTARLLLANCYIKANQPEKARTHLETCILQNRQDVMAMIGLAKLAESQKDLKEHEKWIKKAYYYPTGKANKYIREQYIRQVIEIKDVKEAIQQREKIFKREKTNLNNLLRLARMYEKTRQVGKAQEKYEYIFKVVSDKIRFSAVLADFYRRNKLSSKADALFGDMLKNAKDSKAKAAVCVAYGNFLQNFDFASARAMYNKAIQADKNNTSGYKALADLSSLEAQTLAQQGKTTQSKAKWNESINIIKKIVDQNPDDLRLKKVLFRQYISAGMVSKAIMEFQKLVDEYPEDSGALIGLGLAKMKKRDLAAAEKLFKQAVRLQPEAAESHVFLSEIYRAHGDLFSAVVELRLASQLSKNLGLKMDLAKLHLSMGKNDDAARVFNEIISQDDLYIAAYKGLINICGIQEKWSALERLAATAQEKFPDSPEFYMDLEKMWRKRGDPTRQIRAMESALKLAPDNIKVVRRYLRILIQAKKFEELVSESQKYLNRPAHKGGVTAILAQSKALRLPASKEAFNQFLEALGQIQQPDDVFFVTKLMQEAYGLEKMVANSSEVIKVLPKEWRVLVVFGDTNAKLGKFNQAEKEYNQALPFCNNDNEKTMILHRLARLYSRNNNIEKTASTYKRIIELNPNSIAALNNLAYLYVNVMGKPQEALPLIEQAIQMQPGNMNLIDTHAWTLAKLGKFQQAQAKLDELINKKISGPDILYHMGYVLEKMNDLEGARDYFRQALKALRDQKGNPVQATIQTALDRVESTLNEKE